MYCILKLGRRLTVSPFKSQTANNSLPFNLAKVYKHNGILKTDRKSARQGHTETYSTRITSEFGACHSLYRKGAMYLLTKKILLCDVALYGNTSNQ